MKPQQWPLLRAIQSNTHRFRAAKSFTFSTHTFSAPFTLCPAAEKENRRQTCQSIQKRSILPTNKTQKKQLSTKYNETNPKRTKTMNTPRDDEKMCEFKKKEQNAKKNWNTSLKCSKQMRRNSIKHKWETRLRKKKLNCVFVAWFSWFWWVFAGPVKDVRRDGIRLISSEIPSNSVFIPGISLRFEFFILLLNVYLCCPTSNAVSEFWFFFCSKEFLTLPFWKRERYCEMKTNIILCLRNFSLFLPASKIAMRIDELFSPSFFSVVCLNGSF